MKKIFLLFILLGSSYGFAEDSYKSLDGSDPKDWFNWSDAPIATKNGLTFKMLIPNDSDGYTYFYTVRGDLYSNHSSDYGKIIIKEIIIDDVPLLASTLLPVNGPSKSGKYLFRSKIEYSKNSHTMIPR